MACICTAVSTVIALYNMKGMKSHSSVDNLYCCLWFYIVFVTLETSESPFACAQHAENFAPLLKAAWPSINASSIRLACLESAELNQP